MGVTALHFEIGRTPHGIIFGETESTIPLQPADRVQPATHPFLTHMHIIGVADDTAPTFPWPIMVCNPRGITCQDVFEAIYENFQEHVTQEEYFGWTLRRREQCSRAYYMRVRSSNSWNSPATPGGDALRRIDYMGDRVMFRGLESSPNKDGSWIMFVGPA